MSEAHILIVDDDDGVRYTLRGILEDAGFSVEERADGESALRRIRDGGIDLVISDLRMPGLDGLQLLESLGPGAPRVVLITAHGSEAHAVRAMKAGALDYFRKPFDNDELLTVVQRAIATQRLAAENERLAGELNLSRSLVFGSAAMSRLAALVQRVGPRDVTVLITGESGTGKERVAEAIVRASTRRDGPFVRFNCAAMTPELADAELFGHSRGAFTGADRARPGLFREAHGGTLLLDEIGELDLALQAKLLRALHGGEVRPVGQERSERVDVRILAATHRDLARRVAEGTFREDLYYRLKVVTLHVPPLRERSEDIPLLARRFLRRAAERFGLPDVVLPPELDARLARHAWPGNVRELENAMESLVALSHDGVLDLGLLPDAGNDASPAPRGLRAQVDAYERGLLVEALRSAGGNKTAAARGLGIGRATLHEKLRKHGLQGGEE